MVKGISGFFAEKARKTFIKRCIEFDTPRLESEQYPEDVTAEVDLSYDGEHKLDYYKIQGADDKEVYLLIHGGAFVYGTKQLDRNFGMHLAKASGLPVANMDYTLMPETDLLGQVSQILEAVRFLVREKGVENVHTVGDSAGGYLAFLSGILLHSEKALADFGMTGDAAGGLAKAGSANLICTAWRAHPRTFAGCYFEAERQLPGFIYDLTEAVEKYGCPPLSFMTGDKDTMLVENRALKKRLEELGISFTYEEFASADERVMHHVFPVAHPEWPESVSTMEMFVRR